MKSFWKTYLSDWPYLIYKAFVGVLVFFLISHIIHRPAWLGAIGYCITDPFAYYYLVYRKKQLEALAAKSKNEQQNR